MSTSIETYRSVSQGTTSPRLIILKAFEAAGRFIGDAQESAENGDSPTEHLLKARMVIGGLMTALNFDAGEIAQNFLRLYLFVLDRIQASQTEGRDVGLDEAKRVLETLHSAWEEMPADEAQMATASSGRSMGLNLRG